MTYFSQKVCKSLLAISLLMVAAPAAPARAGWFQDLTGIETPKFMRSMDITDPNSGISGSALGRVIHKVGNGIDPTNPERNGGWWPKLDITNPHQPISQFCDPIAKYGGAAAATYYGAPPQASAGIGAAASGILCGGGSDYGASRRAAANDGMAPDQAAGQPQSFDDWKKAQDYLFQKRKEENDALEASKAADREAQRQHELKMANQAGGSGLEGLMPLMQMQRRPLMLPSFQ